MSDPVTASGEVLVHATVEASAHVEPVPTRPAKVALGVGVAEGPAGYLVLSWGVRYRPVHSPHVEVEAQLGEVIRLVDLSASDAEKLVSAGRIRLHYARGST